MLHWDAMRPASIRSRFFFVAPTTLAIAALLLVCFVVTGIAVAQPAFADGTTLSIDVDKSLSLVGNSVTVRVTGDVGQSLVGSRLVVSLRGPVVIAQVGQTTVDATTAVELARTLGALPGAGQPGAGAAPAPAAPGTSTAQELTAGKLKATVTVPGGSPAKPGAYLVSVQVRSGNNVIASGRAWIGKVAARKTPLDVSFVLPVSLGIHRDWSGTFYDQVLEKATLPVDSGLDTLRGLAAIPGSLPDWRLTLAVEPFLLTQLRDMADGYLFRDQNGDETEVDNNDLASQNATAVLSDLAAVAASESVEIVASPYTGAALGLLAAEGWRDGLEQIQMGKQELQSTLGLSAPLVGAYAPDLTVVGESLAYYAEASVEYVVVGQHVLGSLSEQVPLGTVAVRTENAESDRVTLVFASSGLAEVMKPPWDADVFGAALAAELAANSNVALVIAPKDVHGLIPLDYVAEIGSMLTGQSWMRTQKLQELLSAHTPESRPILLQGTTPQPEGYIEGRIFDGVRKAHVPVSDLAAAADTTKAAVDQAHQLLYVAESRWWSREGTSPQDASMGLAYAAQALSAAAQELDKVRFAKVESPLMTDGQGTVRLTIENAAEYTVKAELRLTGEGLSFPEGAQVPVELPPGRTVFQVNIVREGGAGELTGTLLVGTSVVDGFDHALRVVRLWEILPWVLSVAGLLCIAGVYLVVRRRRRRGRAAASEEEHSLGGC